MKLQARIFIAVFVTAITLLLDSYVVKGLQVLMTPESGGVSIYWITSILILAVLAITFLVIQPAKGIPQFLTGYFSFFISTLIAFKLLHFSSANFALIERSSAFSYLAIAFAIFMLFFVIYGVIFGKYRYKIHKQILYFEDLPSAFENFKIVQISDIHSGSFSKQNPIKKGIDLINAQKADLFVFTGDLVNNVATEIEPWIPFFQTIKAPYGQYSILGNHDYGDYVAWPSEAHKSQNLDKLKSHHKTIGFRLLLDEHIHIEKAGQSIKLVGIENWGEGFGKRGNLNKALQGTNHHDFKVLLSHDPSHWDAEVKNHDSKIHLTLSGHTHGMQFGFELFGFKWSPVKYRYKNWAGLTEENKRNLYVNRGFGFLGFSGRVGIWPEITVIELRKK
ncbi:MAG: metallophosphoesterase [Bacteroidetes bacterium]|nr:metallophosphoesterase [Bacteroidota bacterium]